MKEYMHTEFVDNNASKHKCPDRFKVLEVLNRRVINEQNLITSDESTEPLKCQHWSASDGNRPDLGN